MGDSRKKPRLEAPPASSVSLFVHYRCTCCGVHLLRRKVPVCDTLTWRELVNWAWASLPWSSRLPRPAPPNEAAITAIASEAGATSMDSSVTSCLLDASSSRTGVEVCIPTSSFCLHQFLSIGDMLPSPRRLGPSSAPRRIAGMATVASRRMQLREAVASLAPQVDHLFVYCNYGNLEDEPALQGFADNVTFTMAREFGDLGDTGKFSGPLAAAAASSGHADCIILTCDDDIVYPVNYVDDMVNCIKRYGNKAVVSYHGGVLPSRVTSFAGQRNMVHFAGLCEEDVASNCCGTGVCGFHASALTLSMCSFERVNAADLFLALACQQQRVPMVVAAHEKGWIVEQQTERGSLWDQEVAAGSSLSEENTARASQHRWRLLPTPKME